MADGRMKDFIIVGNMNAITYKDVFPFIKNNKFWTGFNFNKTMEFVLPNDYKKWDRVENGQKIGKVPGICWYTNVSNEIRSTPLDLYKRYSNDYPKYDNYDAIEVSKTCEIPMDYNGVMGVPISFLGKYCPTQFEIVGATESEGKGFSNGLWDEKSGVAQALVKGQRVYKRIFIRKVK